MKKYPGADLVWADLQLFLAVAREGGLSPAARATGKSPATLGRRMLALERTTGYDLFIRHDRGYELTAKARELLEELGEVERNIDRLTAPADEAEMPLVKVSAGTWTTFHLLERIDEILGTPPDIRLRFVATESILDIPHREITIGFRNTRPSQEALAARRMSRVEFAPYAVPGAPRRWIKVLADTPSARWLSKKIGNDAICEVSAPRNSLDLALLGKGIALLPTFVGDARSELQRTGDAISELAHDLWMVTHQDDRHLPPVRRTIDRLYQVLERD